MPVAFSFLRPIVILRQRSFPEAHGEELYRMVRFGHAIWPIKPDWTYLVGGGQRGSRANNGSINVTVDNQDRHRSTGFRWYYVHLSCGLLLCSHSPVV